jgi:D-beta-D-heptose 7-phosphate kinase/D-beta-D-heptose 1-phosphate adenosyltransferase
MKSLETFKEQNALVIGDLMIDKYIIGNVSRISPEAPVPVLNQTRIERKLGGAGNVLANLKSLGARVHALGRIGNDTEGRICEELLSERGIDCSKLWKFENTIVKTRVISSNQQFLRIDEEKIISPNAEYLDTLKNNIDDILKNITVVVLSDYAKGFISDELASLIIQACNMKNIPVVVDPKGKNCGKYKGATAITPNNKEFLDMSGVVSLASEDSIKNEAIRLLKENNIKYFIHTRSEKGISVIEKDSGLKSDFPTQAKEIVDVTGAGDTVVSVIALAIGAGFETADAINLANIAASIVISKFGTAQTTTTEIEEHLFSIKTKDKSKDEVLKIIANLKNQGKRIVFTNGCFDLVHAGHIKSFQQAKSFGDVLIVAVNSDDSIRRLKGESRPVVDLKNRIALLKALECVDFVVPFEEDTPQNLIEAIKPDVMVKGEDWKGKVVAGADFVKSYGGKVEFIKLEQGLSTTHIIEKIRMYLK